MFGVDNSLPSYADNRKNNILVVGEGPNYGNNGSFGLTEKRFSIIFGEANTKFCLRWYYNAHDNYLFVNGKKSPR